MGYSEEETAEFDSEITIDAICDALGSYGWEAIKIGSIKNLAEALVSGERWDAVFNFCEGMKGLAREAQVPTLLDAYDIPYVFSDALTMALTLDKAMTKHIVRSHGIPTADFALIEKQSDIGKVNLPFPLFLKPVAEGSGKGVNAKSRVEDRKALSAVAKDLLRKYRQPVLAETFLSGREFTVGITGTADDARVLGVTEIARATPLPEAKAAAAVALGAWRALRCRDGGRVDIRCDAKGKPHFIEVNPIAGLRPEHSDLCFIANYEGITYRQLIGKIMASFLKRNPALALRRAAA
jgi:D-alanine-D-alanine ligase